MSLCTWVTPVKCEELMGFSRFCLKNLILVRRRIMYFEGVFFFQLFSTVTVSTVTDVLFHYPFVHMIDLLGIQMKVKVRVMLL